MVPENAKNVEKDVDFTFNFPSPVKDDQVSGVCDGEIPSNELRNGLAVQNSPTNSVKNSGKHNPELVEFVDLQDWMSVKSTTEGDTSGDVERSLSLTTPISEFYDAWEEIARHLRQSRKRKQRLVCRSIAAAITLGTAALAWSYLPTGKEESSSPSESQDVQSSE